VMCPLLALSGPLRSGRADREGVLNGPDPAGGTNELNDTNLGGEGEVF
jgi:hypothetical protein